VPNPGVRGQKDRQDQNAFAQTKKEWKRQGLEKLPFQNQVAFGDVLCNIWFSAAQNMTFGCKDLKSTSQETLKSNRNVTLGKQNGKKATYQSGSELDLLDASEE
jgi:hypothetical protein